MDLERGFSHLSTFMFGFLLFGLLSLFIITNNQSSKQYILGDTKENEAQEVKSEDLLPAPQNFKLNSIECKSSKPFGNLSWAPVSQATNYRVKISDSSAKSWEEFITSQTNYLVELKTEGTKLLVEAFRKDGGTIVQEGKLSSDIFVSSDKIKEKCDPETENEKEIEIENKNTSQITNGSVEKIKDEDKDADETKDILKLEEKVGQLEEGLKEAEKRQNVLENLLERILNTLKDLLKFKF